MSQSMDKSAFRVCTFLLVVLLILKLSLFIYFPMPNPDGPWSLSHTFSIINGHFFESSFAHAYMGFYNLPYMGSLLSSPFYMLFTGTSWLIYSIFILNICWIIITLFLSYRMLKDRGDNGTTFFIFSTAFVLSTYTYSLRPEIFLLPFIFLLQYLLEKYTYNIHQAWLISFLSAVIGLSHPVGGFYAVFFLVIFCIDNSLGFRKLIPLLLGTGLFVILMYGPVVIYNFNLWQLNFIQRGFENDTRHIDLSYPIKFYTYSLPFFVVTVFYIINAPPKNRLKEIGYLLCCIFLLMLFMRSYYFPYLFHFVFWRLCKNRISLTSKAAKIIYFVAALSGFSICYLIPFYQYFENRYYRDTFMHTLEYAKSTVQNNSSKHVWVPSIMAMSVIDQPNARMYIPYAEQLSGERSFIDSNTIYLVPYKNDVFNVLKYSIDVKDSFFVKNIIPPVKGLKRIGFMSSRTDSLGLWMISAKPIRP